MYFGKAFIGFLQVAFLQLQEAGRVLCNVLLCIKDNSHIIWNSVLIILNCCNVHHWMINTYGVGVCNMKAHVHSKGSR
jgi:hypothetical protein